MGHILMKNYYHLHGNKIYLLLNKNYRFYNFSTIPDGKLIRVTPWIMINGKINEIVLKKWIGTVLSYCLKNPKIPFRAITQRFCYLKPVDIFSLLEVNGI